MTRWDENEMLSIYPGVSRIYTLRRSFHLRYPCISVHPSWLLNNILGGHDRASFRDALGGRDRVNWEMHLEAVIDRVWRWTGRPWSSEFGDALGGRAWAILDMHLEAEIEWTQRCTPRVWPSEFGDELAGYDQARLEEYLEAVDLEGGATAAESLLIG